MNLRTGDISEYHNKGMHTTTFSEMISLPGGGYLIDTPGIKGFGTIEMADAEISHYFRELFKYSEECRFNNCTHRHEPGCAVIQAVNDGLISESRYKSYLSILDDRMEASTGKNSNTLLQHQTAGRLIPVILRYRSSAYTSVMPEI